MDVLEKKAEELRNLVQAILFQFRVLDFKAANGPHVELSIQEVRVIEYLGDRGPRIMRELADYLLLAVNSVTTTVDHLEAKGLVRRNRSSEDRRIFLVELTDSGREAYQGAVAEKHRLLSIMLGSLDETDQEKLLSLFQKIARVGQDRVDQVRG